MIKIRWIEDGLMKLHQAGFNSHEAESTRKWIQKKHPVKCLPFKKLFLSKGKSEADWEEVCKDFLEGYNKSHIFAIFGTTDPDLLVKLDKKLFGKLVDDQQGE